MHSDPMTDKSLALNPALYEYLQSVSVQETEELRQLREVTAQLPRAIMQIPPEQGQFMSCLLYTSPSPRDLSTSRMPSSA